MKTLPSIRVPHRKSTAASAPARMNVPSTVTIPMSMHIGAPAKPVVAPGDRVEVGQLIGEPGGFVSSPVHASVSGTVKKVGGILLSSGKTVPAVTIESDGAQTPFAGLKPPDVRDLPSFLTAVAASGAVGLGGAGFPTAVKLSLKDPSKLEVVLVNGAECEPYITSDTRTMLDRGEELLDGARLVRTYLDPPRIVFCVEDNKPECAERLRALTRGEDRMEVRALPSAYPQGGEKVLIYNVTGRVVPEGGLPIDAGAVVLNCTTLATIARYVRTGMPLVEKCVTVDGPAVKSPRNVLAPIGASLRDVFASCGGFREEPKKVLYGGPMMGLTVPDLDAPILKNTNAVLAFGERDAALPPETACIRCGSCVRACPMRLMPVEIEHAYDRRDGERLKKLRVNLCFECGCCAYVCPARRPLVQINKLAKGVLASYLAAQKAEAEKAAARAKEAEKP